MWVLNFQFVYFQYCEIKYIVFDLGVFICEVGYGILFIQFSFYLLYKIKVFYIEVYI